MYSAFQGRVDHSRSKSQIGRTNRDADYHQESKNSVQYQKIPKKHVRITNRHEEQDEYDNDDDEEYDDHEYKEDEDFPLRNNRNQNFRSTNMSSNQSNSNRNPNTHDNSSRGSTQSVIEKLIDDVFMKKADRIMHNIEFMTGLFEHQGNLVVREDMKDIRGKI